MKSQCHGIMYYLPICNKTLTYFEVNIGLLDHMNIGWLQILGLGTFTVLERCDYYILLLLHKKKCYQYYKMCRIFQEECFSVGPTGRCFQ